jgi:hypothetical protein
MAAKNKCLAENNKSCTAGKTTKKPIRRSMAIGWAFDGHDASGSQIVRATSRAHPAHERSGDYRVNFRDGNESTAYYTDNLEDAVSAVLHKARKRRPRSDQ